MAAGGIGEKFTSEQVLKLHHDITRPEQYVINFEYLRRRAIRNMAS
jgi:L-fuculose-phosphate aldolase